MNFGDQLLLYQVMGSAHMPDAESLTIVLLQQQVVGMPVRQRDGEDWILLTYQDLGNVSIMRRLSFAMVIGGPPPVDVQ